MYGLGADTIPACGLNITKGCMIPGGGYSPLDPTVADGLAVWKNPLHAITELPNELMTLTCGGDSCRYPSRLGLLSVGSVLGYLAIPIAAIVFLLWGRR